MHWHTIACTEYLYTCVVNTSVLASYLLLILHDRCNALQSLDIHEGNIIMLRFTNIEICYNNSRSSTCVLYFFLSTNKIIFLLDNFYFSTFITFYEYMVLYGVRDRHLVIYMYYLFFIFIDYYNYYYYYTILYVTIAATTTATTTDTTYTNVSTSTTTNYYYHYYYYYYQY